MKAKLYEEIRERIKETMHEIKYVDLYRGQDRIPKEHYPYPLPAVFVNFDNIRWTNAAAGHQQGDTIISLRLMQDTLGDTFDTSEAETANIEELKLSEKLWDAVEGLSGIGYCSLNRINETFEYGVAVLTFTCEMFQKKGIIETTVNNVELNIDVYAD